MKSKLLLIIMILLLPVMYLFAGASVVEARCEDARPEDPILISAVPGEKSVVLTWAEPPSNVTYYVLRYGLTREEMQWGNANIGGDGTTTFTVNELENGIKYFFQIGAGNGCRPGGFSNTMSVTAGLNKASIRQPKLGLHKDVQVLGIIDEEKAKEAPKKEVIKPVAAVDPRQDNCAFNCNSWPLLVGEVVALVIFFYAAHKYHVVRPIFSVLIPISTILLYYQFHGMCYSYKFLCRYFIPLTITSYLLTLIFEKFSLLFRHSQVEKATVQ